MTVFESDEAFVAALQSKLESALLAVVQFPTEDGALFVVFSDSDVPLLPTVELCAE